MIWINNFPESMHHLDMERFYTFIKTVARYRSTKWRSYDYFSQRILGITPHFSTENIEHFWDIMQTCLDFHKTSPIELSTHTDGEYGYTQIGVKDGEIYQIPITQHEFLHKGREV